MSDPRDDQLSTPPHDGGDVPASSASPSLPPPGASGSGAPPSGDVHGGWVPPGATTASGWAGPGDPIVAVDHDDGPPPPPGVRRRQRTRRLALAAVVVLVVGIPLGLALASTLSQPDEAASADGDAAAGDDATDGASPDAPGSGDDGAAPDDDVDDGPSQAPLDPSTELEPPDATELDGVDATFAELLVDIDASEMTMIGFQRDLGAVFEGADGERALAAARSVAEQRREQLLEVRSRLEGPSDDADAEAVRDVYVEHLDSWERFMGAVEEDPTVLAMDGRDAIFTLDINATADAFSRELQARMPGELDDEVRSYADAILDRGFRSAADADV